MPMTRDFGTSEPLLSRGIYDAAESNLCLDEGSIARGHSRQPRLASTFRTTANLKRILFFQSIFNLGIGLFVLYLYTGRQASQNPLFPQLLYSPAQNVLEYRVTKYFSGFGRDKSLLQGLPSPELDAAWTELEKYGIVTVTKEAAEKMRYKTRPTSILKTPDQYTAEIDAFHQLHCLNVLRMAHHRSYYENSSHFLAKYGPPGDPETDAALFKHLEYCIEGLRQPIMCSADVSPIVWVWTEKGALASGSIVHTCRDWDAVVGWAKEHVVDNYL